MKLALFLASKGFIGKWFSSGRDQLAQPKKYLDILVNHSFLKYMINDKLKESITFINGGELTLTNLTELNARSARADFIIYDEEAQADLSAYRAGVSILSASNLSLMIHISTPVKASVFEENHDRLKLRELKTGEQFVFLRSWYEIEFLARKREWYEEQEIILPGWYFRQEHCCSFELPAGAVFQNVEYGTIPDWLRETIKDTHTCSGVDWNPVSGHKLVGIKWTKDLKNCIITEEIDLGQGYSHELTDGQFNIIAKRASHGNHINTECSGINEAYTTWLNKKKSETRWNWPNQNWHTEEWDTAGINKLKIAMFIIQNGVCIWVDKLRFTETAKEIENCRWDPESETPKLEKKPAASPHYLDAYLHAASEENRRETTISFEEWY